MIKQSLKNITRQLDKYLIINITYIISFLIIFLSTNSMMLLFNNETLKKASKSVPFRYFYENVVLSILIGIIIFMLCILTINISKYIIKLRSKEFSIYLIIAGVQKSYLRKLIIFEQLFQTLIQSIIALILGLIILTPFNMYFINNTLDAYYINFKNYFLFEYSSIIIYGLVTLFVFIFATAVQLIIFNHQNICNLMKTAKTSENTNTKKISNKPLLVSVLALLSLFVIKFIGYISFKAPTDNKGNSLTILLWIVLAFAISNLLLYKSFLPWIFQKLQKSKKLNYYGTNSVLLTQINSKIRSLSTILGTMTVVVVLCLSIISFLNALNSILSFSTSKTVVVTNTEHKTNVKRILDRKLQLVGEVHYVHQNNEYYFIWNEVKKYELEDPTWSIVTFNPVFDPFDSYMKKNIDHIYSLSNKKELISKGYVNTYYIYKTNDQARFVYSLRNKKNLFTNITQTWGKVLPYKAINIVIFMIPLLIIFVQSTSIMFKFLSTSWDPKKHYEILDKLGIADNEIKKLIFKENVTILLFPIIIGLIENIVGLIFIINPFLKITLSYEINFLQYFTVFLIFLIIYILLVTVIHYMYKKVVLSK